MFLGIDVGTTAVKVVLYDESFKPIALGLKEYNLLTPSQDIVETDTETYWLSLKYALKQIKTKLEVNLLKIDALSISSQGCSFVVIDKEGRPLRNTIVWLDNRAKLEAKLIRKEFNPDNVYRTTGCPDVDPCWSATKLYWIKRNEPNIFKKINKVLLLEDYLIYRLTGKFIGNGSMYCETLLYDINKHCWWDEMLNFIGLKETQLPELYPSGIKIGAIKNVVSRELEIYCENVVTGGEDQACGCIGTGNVESGKVSENTGSAINLTITTDKPLFNSKVRMPCFVHVVEGKYILVPWNKTGGIILKWFRDNFGKDYIDEAESKGLNSYALMDKDTSNIPPGSNGVVLLPFFDGSISPEMDENAKGVLYGLNLSTTRGHIIRSILESVAYMLRSNIEEVEKVGIKINEIISSGGASKSELWNQIKADVLVKKIITVKNQNSSCLGAAILAGFGCGFFKTIKEACDLIIKIDKKYMPDKRNKSIYNGYYKIYKGIYKSLKPVFARSSSLFNNSNTK